MVIEMMDEALSLPGRGVALMSMDEQAAPQIKPGMTLVDARGNRHVIGEVTEHDGVWMLRVPDGDAAYFSRLFRDVRVDATHFAAEDA